MRAEYQKIVAKIRGLFVLDNLAPAIMLGLAFVWMAGTISVLNQNYSLQRQVDQGELDNDVIKLQNQNLQLQQAYFKTDEFLELKARALLGRAKPGENLVLLPENQPEKSAARAQDFADAAEVASAKKAPQTNAEQWGAFLFGAR